MTPCEFIPTWIPVQISGAECVVHKNTGTIFLRRGAAQVRLLLLTVAAESLIYGVARTAFYVFRNIYDIVSLFALAVKKAASLENKTLMRRGSLFTKTLLAIPGTVASNLYEASRAPYYSIKITITALVAIFYPQEYLPDGVEEVVRITNLWHGNPTQTSLSDFFPVFSYFQLPTRVETVKPHATATYVYEESHIQALKTKFPMVNFYLKTGM